MTTSLDRPNIKIVSTKRKPSTGKGHSAEHSFLSVLNPLLDKLLLGKLERTVFYAKLEYCGLGYEEAMRRIANVRSGELNITVNTVQQFHAPCSNEVSIHWIFRILF